MSLGFGVQRFSVERLRNRDGAAHLPPFSEAKVGDVLGKGPRVTSLLRDGCKHGVVPALCPPLFLLLGHEFCHGLFSQLVPPFNKGWEPCIWVW